MFTALTLDLMGAGAPALQAQLLGCSIDNITCAGTAQNTGTVIGAQHNAVALLTTSSTDYAATLSSDIPVGMGVIVTNLRASIYAASVFPPSGCNIDAGSTNAATTLAGSESAFILRISATAFRSYRFPRAGMVPDAATGVGTAQGGSSPTLLSGRAYQLTTAVGQTAATIDANMAIGSTLEVYTITATTGLVFPPSGCTIDQGSANASVSVAQNKGRIIRRMTATAFNSILSA